MECPSVELKKERFIKELLEASPKILEKVDKPIDVVQWLTELATLCFILFSEDHSATTASSSSSISLSIY